ncbi:MAG: hypothetical protein QXN34_03160, partial [Archaeoglobaceae archaeon]
MEKHRCKVGKDYLSIPVFRVSRLLRCENSDELYEVGCFQYPFSGFRDCYVASWVLLTLEMILSIPVF